MVASDLLLAVDVVLAFAAAELVVLLAWQRWTGRGLRPADYALSLLSGLLLMAALRCTLTPGAGAWALLCLAASGVTHALDLRLRWQRSRTPGPLG